MKDVRACRCRNLADEHMPPAERIGDTEAKRRGLWSTTDCAVHSPAAPAAEADLRADLARELFRDQPVPDGLYEHECEAIADVVLALPALRRLVEQAAEAARLQVMLFRVLDQGATYREAVGRARKLADEIEAEAARSAPAAGLTADQYVRAWRADAPDRIRRALDGTDG